MFKKPFALLLLELLGRLGVLEKLRPDGERGWFAAFAPQIVHDLN